MGFFRYCYSNNKVKNGVRYANWPSRLCGVKTTGPIFLSDRRPFHPEDAPDGPISAIGQLMQNAPPARPW